MTHLPTILEHNGVVLCCACSSTGILATGSQDQNDTDIPVITLWDMQSGDRICWLIGHVDVIYSCAFSHNGHLLASSAADMTCIIWDVDAWKCLYTIKDRIWDTFCCTFSADDRYLATGSTGDDPALKIWNVCTGTHLWTRQGHTNHITHCAFSPTSPLLVSVSADTTIMAWDSQTGGHIKTLRGHTKAINSCCIIPAHDDMLLLATASSDCTVKIWDMFEYVCVRTFYHPDVVVECATVPYSLNIVTISFDFIVRFWHVCAVDSCDVLRNYHPATDDDWFETHGPCCVSPDGVHFVIAFNRIVQILPVPHRIQTRGKLLLMILIGNRAAGRYRLPPELWQLMENRGFL